MTLKNYATGTQIQIGDRRFEKVEPASFWRELNKLPGNCIKRPAVSLEAIEAQTGRKHMVVKSHHESAQ